MPLDQAFPGTVYFVRKIQGASSFKHHLGALGFSRGAAVKVLETTSTSLVVQLRGSRIVIGLLAASQIEVSNKRSDFSDDIE